MSAVEAPEDDAHGFPKRPELPPPLPPPAPLVGKAPTYRCDACEWEVMFLEGPSRSGVLFRGAICLGCASSVRLATSLGYGDFRRRWFGLRRAKNLLPVPPTHCQCGEVWVVVTYLAESELPDCPACRTRRLRRVYSGIMWD